MTSFLVNRITNKLEMVTVYTVIDLDPEKQFNYQCENRDNFRARYDITTVLITMVTIDWAC